MGQTASKTASKDGPCQGYVPLHTDPRAYALTKVHGVPLRKDALDMYPEYTSKMACEDVVSMRRTGTPMHAVPKYHKILKKGGGFFGGGGMHDPRHFVFTRVYGLRPEEIKDIDRHPQYYTRDMAIQELAWQEKRKRHPEMQPFRYDLSRSIRFTNAQHGYVYKPGAKGYAHGYSYKHNQGHFVIPSPADPRQAKKNKERAAYERGLQNGRKAAAVAATSSTSSGKRSRETSSMTNVTNVATSSPRKKLRAVRPRSSVSKTSEPFHLKSPPESGKLYMQRHVTT